jgi:hypothetical protein
MGQRNAHAGEEEQQQSDPMQARGGVDGGIQVLDVGEVEDGHGGG